MHAPVKFEERHPSMVYQVRLYRVVRGYAYLARQHRNSRSCRQIYDLHPASYIVLLVLLYTWYLVPVRRMCLLISYQVYLYGNGLCCAL